MAKRITGSDLGTDLCKALGFDPSNVTKLSIHAEYGDLARVNVELIPTDEQGKRIAGILANEEYTLVKQNRKPHKESDS